jgi:hypothetical protein
VNLLIQLVLVLCSPFLKDNEIDAVLLDEGASSWTAGRLLVPVRLVVPSYQLDAAQNLLKEFEGECSDDC